MKTLRPEEEWAKAMIAAHLQVVVEQHDDNTSVGMGVYDLTIMYPNGKVGAVEVTAAADPGTIEWWNLMHGSGDRWQAENVKGGWAIHVDPSSSVKRLHQELPLLLSVFEALGIENFETDDWRKSDPSVDFARDLGIRSGFRSGTDFPGSIYVYPDIPAERSGGMVADNGDAAADWIGQFLREAGCSDVLAKLRGSGVEERHAFVILPGFTTAPFSVFDLLLRDDAVLPRVAPDLPDGVTNVWMVSTWSSGIGFYWSPDNGWEAVTKQIQSTAHPHKGSNARLLR